MLICLPCLSAKTVPVRAKGKDAANSWCVIQMPSINWKFNYSCASSSSQQTRLTKVCWPMKSCSKLLTVKASCASLRICFWCRLSWRSSWFLCRCRPSTCLKDSMEKVTSFHSNKWMETKYLLPKVRFLEFTSSNVNKWHFLNRVAKTDNLRSKESNVKCFLLSVKLLLLSAASF